MFCRYFRTSTLLAAGACATVVFVADARADNIIRYASITGSNANACTLAAPCRTLQRGIDSTPGGGELRVLDSGFYGVGATIAKTMTISGDHVTVTSIQIIINSPSSNVTLRGLELNGSGTGSSSIGIHIQAASGAHIEGCVIHDFGEFGILQDSTGGQLFVTDSIVRDIGLDGLAAEGQATVDNSRFEHNARFGINAIGTVAISRTIASGNIKSGIQTRKNSTITSTTAANNHEYGYLVLSVGQITLEASVAHGNGIAGLGLFDSTSGARISNSVLTNNAIGIQNASQVFTRLNNTISGNTTNLSGNALIPLRSQ